MNIKVFLNFIIILQLILFSLSGIVTNFEEGNLPYSLNFDINEQSELLFRSPVGIVGSPLLIVLTILYFISCSGLIKRMKWSRKLYLFSNCLSLVNVLSLELVVGYTVRTPIESFLGVISWILIGVTLGIIYWGDERRYYSKCQDELSDVSNQKDIDCLPCDNFVKQNIGKLKQPIYFLLVACVFFLLGTSIKLTFEQKKIPLSKKFPGIKTPDEMIQEYAKDPRNPIKYDPEADEYNIIYETLEGVKHSIRIYFCPLSGAELRESQSDKYFTRPTKKEIKRLLSLAKNAKILQDVELILGKPNKVSHDLGKDRIQYIYDNLSETAELIIHETKTGRIYFTVGAKRMMGQ